jgi:phytoene synthase
VAVALGVSASLSARLTRQSRTSFYYAFRLLGAEKRRAIYALYSFCRVVDDCVDDAAGDGAPGLDRWAEEVRRCYAGAPATELGKELAQALERFPIPQACLEDVVAGCRMDLTKRRYATFTELRDYCAHVASAVGLASIEIFGYREPRTREYARELGLALQLTNILRDVGPDAARDRVYLPLEDLERFSVSEDEILVAAREPGRPRSDAVTRLLAFETERTREHYARATALLPSRDRRSMLAAEIMGGIYRAILDAFERRGFPIGGERAQIGRARRAWIALRTIPRVRWGI